MQHKIIFFIVLIFTLFSCNSNKENNSKSEEIAEEAFPESEIKNVTSSNFVEDSFALKYSQLLDYYIELKDDLVESDIKEAKKNAQFFNNFLSKMKLKNVPDSLINYWEEQKDVLMLFSNEIARGDDLSRQRKAFYSLSQDMYDLYLKIGIKENILYKQYCPMAFHDEGAFWLSKHDEILNPYFGSDMLHCGEVQEIINN